MRFSKKLTLLLLSAVLISAASGCGKPAAPDSPHPSAETLPAETLPPETSQSSADSPVIIIPLGPDGILESDPAVPADTDPVQDPSESTGSPSESASDPAATDPASEAPVSDGPVDLSKVVALTFDDGPDMRYTSSTNRILDTLSQYGAHATFFVQGIQLTYDISSREDGGGETFAERNKKTLKRASDLGMEIGTHSFDHPRLLDISVDQVKDQVKRSTELIESVTGKEVRLIRPPYGDADEEVMNAVDMPFIVWDVDSYDWHDKDPELAVKKIYDQMQGGSIILMHDIYGTTADAVELLIPKLVNDGYTVVTVSELFDLYGVELQHHHMYSDAHSGTYLQ